MSLLLDELAEPFERIDDATARSILTEHWGLETAEVTRLDTERDDSFRVLMAGVAAESTEAGPIAVVLKVAHPADPPANVDLQLRAMEHARRADPGIPLQRVVPTTAGALSALVAGRTARVLTWIDGELLADRPVTSALAEDTGRMLGRLSRALSGFEHPAADRDLAWDLARLPALRPVAADPLHREVIDRFGAKTVPALTRLPHQVIHNDGHPGNLLADPAAPDRLAGILDFGDIVRSARVCDLGLALAYLVPDAPRPWPVVDALTRGFESSVPLLPEERALLPMLMAARAVARTLINNTLRRSDNGDPGEFAVRNDRVIRRILEEV